MGVGSKVTEMNIAQLKSIKEKLSSAYLEQPLDVFTPNVLRWEEENVPRVLREDIVQLDNILRHAAHKVRTENFAMWTAILDVLEDITHNMEKIEMNVENATQTVPFWKNPITWSIGFVLFLTLVLFSFSLFKIDDKAASGATNFVGKVLDNASDVTKSVIGGGSDNDNSGYNGGYNYNRNYSGNGYGGSGNYGGGNSYGHGKGE